MFMHISVLEYLCGGLTDVLYVALENLCVIEYIISASMKQVAIVLVTF